MLVYNRAVRDEMRLTPGAPAGCVPFLLGRTAINHLIRREAIRHIFLPAFVCRMVPEIFLHHGCTVTLYDHIDGDMTIDDHYLVEFIAGQGSRGSWFFWIDYWGVTGDIPSPVYAACRAGGIRTVVDAVHTLPVRAYQADFTLYGARKLLHLPFGALMTATESPGDGPVLSPVLTWALFCQYYVKARLLARRRSRNSWALARIEQLEHRLLGRELNFEKEPFFLHEEYHYQPLSRELAARDLEGIGRKRQANFNRLAAALGGQVADDGVCPFGFPLPVAERDRLRDDLWAHDVHTSTYWDELHPLAAGSPRAMALASRILTLPVNHDLRAAQVDYVIDRVRTYRANS